MSEYISLEQYEFHLRLNKSERNWNRLWGENCWSHR